MEKEKNKALKVFYIVIISAIVIAAICLIVFKPVKTKTSNVPAPAVSSEPVVAKPKVVEKVVTVEKEITGEIIQDGLNDIGKLVTEEYYFTEVVSFSSVKKLFKTLSLGFTESSYLASYDGVISAGLDFDKVTVEKNDETGVIIVHLPKCSVYSVDIDPESFVLYSEKEGLGNPISVSDYNDSLIELENTAEKKAISKGLLDKADENARRIVANFVSGIPGLEEYTVNCVVG